MPGCREGPGGRAGNPEGGQKPGRRKASDLGSGLRGEGEAVVTVSEGTGPLQTSGKFKVPSL